MQQNKFRPEVLFWYELWVSVYAACCPWNSLLIIRDIKTLTCFLDMPTRNCLINKTKVVREMLLLTVVGGTTGIPAFKSTAVIMWPPPMVLLPCCSLSPPALLSHPGLSQREALVVFCSCLLMLQVQLQLLACALLHDLLVKLVNCWCSHKVRPWCEFTQCTWQAVGEVAWVRWCRSQFPALVLEPSLKHTSVVARQTDPDSPG